MTPESTPESTPETTSGLTPEQREARRRRLEKVFGDVLPEQTSDDAEPESTTPDRSEEWLRRQVPPHHG